MINQPIQSERDEAPPLKKSKAQHQVVQGAMSGMQTPHMGWQSSQPREIQADSQGFFSSPLDNPSDMVHPMMEISDFATDNGPFQLEEGQIPPSAGTVQQPLTNTQSTAQRPIMSSQYQSVVALASQCPDNMLPAIAMTQVRESALVSTFDHDRLWTLCSDYDRFKRDGGRAPIDRFLTPQVAKALRGMIGTLDPTRADAPLEEIVRDYVHVARNGILPPATGPGSTTSDNMRRMEWEFLRNDLLAVKPNSKILHSNFLVDVNTFALGMDVVFEKHPYFDVVFDSEYDLQKDVLNAVLLAFEHKAGEWCDASLLWQTFVQQVLD
jgi:hypothetical protein